MPRSLPMLIVLSPAKTLDYETPVNVAKATEPDFIPRSAELVSVLREMPPASIASLMKISDPLAQLNVARFASWSETFSHDNARQALLAFDGDVYDGLDARSLDRKQLDWAQRHLRVLSGLYGLLRPLDLMQPYRLEMGAKLANPRGRDLYAFWGERIAGELREAMTGFERPVLVNLASDEYFRSVRRPAMPHPVVQPVFQEQRAGVWRVISFSAKRARGSMTRYAIENRITDPHDLKRFDRDGYRYDPAASDEFSWVFRREPS